MPPEDAMRARKQRRPRAPGQHHTNTGQAMPLAWQVEDMHFFDAEGRRMQ